MKNKYSRIKLRYGENPNQKSYLINHQRSSIFNYQVSGKKISYNNLIDLDSGLRCLKEFYEPTSIILKHTNPCGISSATNIELAFKRSYESDPKSAFGGIILLNRTINKKLALKISSYFAEAIVAPRYTIEALKILKSKNKLIVINSLNVKTENHVCIRSVNSGILYQDKNNLSISKANLKLASKTKSSNKIINDLIFAVSL